jgi:uncharacterized protein
VAIAGEERLVLTAKDGVHLEARGRWPAGAVRTVVVCHPHPLYGGTMHNAVVVAITKALAERGAATLRFNFRGVAGGEGSYDGGNAEALDAAAAVVEAKRRTTHVSLAGYSFGAGVALRAAGLDATVDRLSLVAPPVRLFRFEGSPPNCAVQIIAAERDQFSPMLDTQAVALALRAVLEVVFGAEHYFIGSRRDVAGRVAAFVAPDD